MFCEGSGYRLQKPQWCHTYSWVSWLLRLRSVCRFSFYLKHHLKWGFLERSKPFMTCSTDETCLLGNSWNSIVRHFQHVSFVELSACGVNLQEVSATSSKVENITEISVCNNLCKHLKNHAKRDQSWSLN